MIGKLTGIVEAVGAEEVILSVGGVGYLVACGARALSRAPGIGEVWSLHVETQVRQDAIRLFGFASEEERAWFVRLQDIQGVGARVALSVLDVLSPGELVAAAEAEDKARLTRANGVGPRLAVRIVTELKGKPSPPTRFGGLGGKLAAPTPKSADAPPDAGAVDYAEREDAVSALSNLGLDAAAARSAVIAARAGFDAPPGVDRLVKAALQAIGQAEGRR